MIFLQTLMKGPPFFILYSFACIGHAITWHQLQNPLFYFSTQHEKVLIIEPWIFGPIVHMKNTRKVMQIMKCTFHKLSWNAYLASLSLIFIILITQPHDTTHIIIFNPMLQYTYQWLSWESPKVSKVFEYHFIEFLWYAH